MRKTILGLILGFSVSGAGCIFGGGADPAVGNNGGMPDASVSDDGPADGSGNNGADAGPDATGNNGGTNNGQPDAGPSDMPPDVPPDMEPPQTCGDGALQADETCDPSLPATSAGACPTECDDNNACTTDEFVGSADMCNLACQSTAIEVCQNNDGCCPGDCSAAEDSDCDDTVVCGDGVVGGAETCDPAAPSDAAGACPAGPDDCPTQTCRSPRVFGSPQNCDAVCAYVDITACMHDDGCCPAGCDEANDNDCASTCGNAVIEPGEVCDGNCPVSCDDGDACTDDVLSGSAATCDAECSSVAITACSNGDGCCPSACDSSNDDDCSASCGDSVLDAGETCDPPGTCPTSCDDGVACTTDSISGSAANCNVVCTNSAITACKATADGCCPQGCNANTDADCGAVCGNSVVEMGETCDGNCPMGCDDGDACTADGATGEAGQCNLVCSNTAITACVNGDGCCPAGCSGVSDSDCGAVCGNGIREGAETCDGNCPTSCNDGNSCTVDQRFGSSTSCNVTCSHSSITSCINGDGCCPGSCNANNDTDCSATCGNGTVENGETCDGNCPEAGSCNPCQNFTGSANTCDAKCTNDPTCTLCTLGGNCPCANDEACVGGKCVSSGGGQCGSACDKPAYCVAHYGSGTDICNSNSCVQCLQNSDCMTYEFCDGASKTCSYPMTCGGAGNGNDWCINEGAGDTCLNNACEQSCTDNGPCLADEYCTGGYCTPAPTCDQAKNPDVWCGTGWTCVSLGMSGDGVCYESCMSNIDCPQYEACDGGTYTCYYPTSCEKSNDPAGWCVNEGLGNACDANGNCYTSGCSDSCECGGQQYCNSNGDCVNTDDCNLVCDPDEFCRSWSGSGYTCNSNAYSGYYGYCCISANDCDV